MKNALAMIAVAGMALSIMPSAQAGLLFLDTFATTGDMGSSDVNFEYNTNRQSGTLGPVQYRQGNGNLGSAIHGTIASQMGIGHLGKINQDSAQFSLRLSTDDGRNLATVSPERNFNVSAGVGNYLSVSFTVDSAGGAAKGDEDWVAITIGASDNAHFGSAGNGARGQGILSPADNFALLLQDDGRYQALNNGAKIVEGLFPKHPNAAKANMVELRITGLGDGNAFGGAGDALVDVYINRNLVASYTRTGGFKDNYLTLQGYSPGGIDQKVYYFSNLMVQVAPGVGIPLLTCESADPGWTELASEYACSKSASVSVTRKIVRSGNNALLNIGFNNMLSTSDFVRLDVAAFGLLADTRSIPKELSSEVSGVSFWAAATGAPVKLTVEAQDFNGVVLNSMTHDLSQGPMRQFEMPFRSPSFKKLAFWIRRCDESSDIPLSGSVLLDNIYLVNSTIRAFEPPRSDPEMLAWLRKCSIRYFLWNYQSPDGIHGFVPESPKNPDKISVAGLGYAYVNFILAEEDGMISPVDARSRILSMLKWQQAQNWSDGTGGYNGFPYHFYKPDGTNYWPEVSTIDWAMCAAAIRVVRQKYAADPEIVSVSSELLSRPKWESAVAPDNRFTMGFDGPTGKMIPCTWGQWFSEETELVYLEAAAAGVNPTIFDGIVRKKVAGFYPSWFGSSFTYNWLQLWTGVKEPYATNSKMGFQRDAITCQTQFGRPLMGLTPCASIAGLDEGGFILWHNYLGLQGSDTTGERPSEIVRVSPAPYGACLALPFVPDMAIKALREYAAMGFFHPVLGMPDSVRMTELPAGIDYPVAHWSIVDINFGAASIAIEQTQKNSIAGYYLKDDGIAKNLALLISTFHY